MCAVSLLVKTGGLGRYISNFGLSFKLYGLLKVSLRRKLSYRGLGSVEDIRVQCFFEDIRVQCVWDVDKIRNILRIKMFV